MSWIKSEDELPPFGKYVLARHNMGTWRCGTDQANVNCVVVRRIESKPHGNNLKDYEWDTFGATKFFGQDIYVWQHIEPCE